MAPTLTAVPDPARMVVNLTVTAASGAITVRAYTPLAAGGTGSYAVRGSFANGRIVADPDAPLNVDIVYIATDTTGNSPQVTARLNSATAVLSQMAAPTNSVNVEIMADRDQRYRGQSVAHKILGTSEPVVTVEAMAFRSGTYELRAPTAPDFLTLRQLILPGGVLLLRSPCQTEYFDTSFIVTDSGWGPEIPWNSPAPRQRMVAIDYQAVAPDTNPPADIAWTWGDVPAVAATWGDMPILFPTWGDVVTYLPPAAGRRAAPSGPGF